MRSSLHTNSRLNAILTAALSTCIILLRSYFRKLFYGERKKKSKMIHLGQHGWKIFIFLGSCISYPFPDKKNPNTLWHQHEHCPFHNKPFQLLQAAVSSSSRTLSPRRQTSQHSKVLPNAENLCPFIISCPTESQEGRWPSWTKVNVQVKGLQVSQWRTAHWSFTCDQVLS